LFTTFERMNRRLKLINWVKAQHEGQLIKETATPYFAHLLAVANRVAATAPLTFEIGLCHDLLEKTAVTEAILLAQLRDEGYDPEEAEHISSCVTELTRHFTKAANPLPKKMRKALEDERLIAISADAQTVKYADLSYNADWMMAHDRHHAADYLQSKLSLVAEMTTGDPGLQQQVLDQFRNLVAAI
jgi:(p)ppGpp synthase/HD superfamily hydrolase